MAYLTCTDLSVGYAGVPVVRDIAFSVSAGEALFVVGENGAGKSTLLKTLLGLMPPLGGTLAFSDGATAGGIGCLRNETRCGKTSLRLLGRWRCLAGVPAWFEALLCARGQRRHHQRPATYAPPSSGQPPS